MLTDVILRKNESFLNQLRSIHADSISSHNKIFDETDPDNPVAIPLESEEKNTLFKSVESSLKKIESAVLKKINFSAGDYKYIKPKERIQAPVTSVTIKSKLAFLKGEIATFAEKLKSENYKITDGIKNENHTLSPIEKGLFKKIITGLEQLSELY